MDSSQLHDVHHGVVADHALAQSARVQNHLHLAILGRALGVDALAVVPAWFPQNMFSIMAFQVPYLEPDICLQ